MPEYRVHFVTHSTVWVTVDMPDHAPRGALVRAALDRGEFPTLCGPCTGVDASWDLDLCDGWEPYRNDDGRFEIERVDPDGHL